MLVVAPDQLTLTFSEPVSPLVLGLVQPDGERLPLEKFILRDRELSLESPAHLRNGTHVFTWRVVSEDGHPIGGSVVFSIGSHTAPPSQMSGTSGLPVLVLLWAGKVALYCGLFLGVGSAFAHRWLFRQSSTTKSYVSAVICLGVLSLPVLLAAQGLDALGLPLSNIFQPVVWETGARTTLGPSLGVATASFVAALLSRRMHGKAASTLALLGLVGASVALALTGHASSAQPQFFTRPAVALHSVAVAFWVGALLPLGLALKRQSGEEIAALLRFSRTIPIFIVILIISGLGLAFIQLRSVPDLWRTEYGQVLLVKLGLVFLLLLLAALNRWHLTPPAAKGNQNLRKQLVRSISVELVVVLLIFGTVAGWRFTPPPRNIVPGQPLMVNLHGERAMAHMTVNQNSPGPVTLRFMLMKANGEMLPAQELNVALSLPSAGVEPIRRKARPGNDGHWSTDEFVIPLPGTWSVEVNVVVSDFEVAKLVGELKIR